MEPNVLSRRIEQLAALAGEETDTEAGAGGTGLAAVRGELAGLRADLAALRGEVGSVRSDIDGLAGRLTGSVAAGRAETGGLARRIADLVNRVDDVGGRVEEVKADLPGLSREVRDGLELVPVRTGAKLDELSGRLGESVGSRVEAVAAEVRRALAVAQEREADSSTAAQALLTETKASVESRLGVLEDTLDAMAERLETLTREGQAAAGDQLRSTAASVAALEHRLDSVSGEQVERIVARLRDVTETRLDTLTTVLVDATRSRNEQLRRELLDVLTVAGAEQEATRNQVAVLADAVRQSESVQVAATVALEGTVASVLAGLRDEITTELDDVAERLFVAVSALQDSQREADTAAAARLDALQASVTEALELSRTQQAQNLQQLAADVAAELGTLRPRIEEVAAATAAATSREAAARTELTQAVESVRERVAIAVSVSAEAVRAAVADASGTTVDATRATHEALLERLDDQHAALTSRVADATTTALGAVAATRETAERLAALAAAQDDVRRSVDALTGDWPRRTDEAVAAARAAADATVQEVRAELRTQLDAVIAEVSRAAGGVDEAKASLLAAADRVAEQTAVQGEQVARAAAAVTKAEKVARATAAPALEKAKPPVKQAPAKKAPGRKAPAKKASPAPAPSAVPSPSAPPTVTPPDAPAAAAPAAAKAPASAVPPVRPPAKRAAVQSMPQVPSPSNAVDAAAPPPARTPAPPAAQDEESRRLFRRRRP